jgi:hypothetical protein
MLLTNRYGRCAPLVADIFWKNKMNTWLAEVLTLQNHKHRKVEHLEKLTHMKASGPILGDHQV